MKRNPFLVGLWLSLAWLCACSVGASTPTQLPESVTMNKGAGRGSWLIIKLRLESGEELPFMVDTGSPITVLDKSLEHRLGKRLEKMWIHFPANGTQQGGIYEAPRLYCGHTPLSTDRYIVALDLKPASARAQERIMGVLGLDCLRHYCMQLDFEAGKLRFLEADGVKPAELGKSFPLTFSTKGQRFPPMFSSVGQNQALPFIQHAGLIGGAHTNLMIDTGNNVDGAVDKRALKGQYLTRFAHWVFKSRALRLGSCVWDGQTYTQIKAGSTRNANQLGLRFLARHLVTLDFPRHTMYLKQIRSNPLSTEAKE